MKKEVKSGDKKSASSRGVHRRNNRHVRKKPSSSSSDTVTDMLKLCLQKVCELQSDLNNEEGDVEDKHDPEAEGYAACVLETLRFLSAQGLPPTHPVVKTLSEKLLNNQ